jgi:hypothetical protein
VAKGRRRYGCLHGVLVSLRRAGAQAKAWPAGRADVLRDR